jgi:hypothetical protein
MLPIYNAIIDDACTGIDRISLVQMPAVESNFLAFAKEKKQMMFNANEEQQMITGVLMRADFPIYRNDAQLGEYYIQFSKETIKTMAEKLLVDCHQNWVNIEHMENSDIQGVDMVELYIKDSSKGITPVGFDEISDGSLFATFKVRNPLVWDCIKNGTFLGFSIEGVFSYEIEVPVETEDVIYDEILSMLDKISNLK